MPDTDKVVALADYFRRDDRLAAAGHPTVRRAPPAAKQDAIPSGTQSMLRGAPMLLNLTMGGNVLGAALMIYDLWQQTYYQIPTLLGLIVQIGMCALFLGLCQLHPRAGCQYGPRSGRTPYWRCNIYALALMPSFWVSNIALDMLAQRFPVSPLLLLPMTAMVYFLVCLRMHFATRETQ